MSEQHDIAAKVQRARAAAAELHAPAATPLEVDPTEVVRLIREVQAAQRRALISLHKFSASMIDLAERTGRLPTGTLARITHERFARTLKSLTGGWTHYDPRRPS